MADKYSYRIRAVFTIIVLSQSLLVATPANAFWFFHHKDSESSAANNNANTPTPPPYSVYQPSAVGQTKGRRLLPANFINNNASANKNKIVPDTPVQSADNVKKQADINLPSLNDSASNVIPVKSASIYTPTSIRIGIGLGIQAAKIATPDGGQLIDNASGEIIANLPAQSEWQLLSQNNCLVMQPIKDHSLAVQQLAKSFGNDSAIKSVAYTTSEMVTKAKKDIDNGYYPTCPTNTSSLSLPMTNLSYTIKPAFGENGPGLLVYNDRLYRGDFVIKQVTTTNKNAVEKSPAAFNIINKLDLEDYLISVVPSEMPSLWPAEALKAQAIAARSYAIANLGKYGSSGYDLKDNTEDQVYLGVRSETQSSCDAISTTCGLVLKYEGKAICAYFHSSSGGGTEAAENVWHTPVPYLKAVVDFDQESPLYSWTKNYSISQTESGLPKDIGQILSIAILAKAPSGRPTHLLINGSNNSRIISGEAARKYFALPSSNFNVTPAETVYIFTGKGFGHGLGLSQWGAKSLAQHGYNAAQILCYYYSGVSIDY